MREEAGFAEVVAALWAGHGATLGGVWGSSCALAAAALQGDCPATLVLVCPRPEDVDALADDLAIFKPVAAERFPAWESETRERSLDDEIYGQRLRVLKQLAGTSIQRWAGLDRR